MSAPPRLFAPSDYQIAIWDAFAGTANVTVKALAGTGKTTTIIHGLRYLPPGSIALLSFSRDAVQELNNRVGDSDRVTARTFHSFGQQALRRHLQVRGDPDRFKVLELTRKTMTELGLLERGADRARYESQTAAMRAIAEFVEHCRYSLITTQEDMQAALRSRDLAIGLSDDYLAWLSYTITWKCANDLSSYDYTDMIWQPVIKNLPLPDFDHFLVDEAQDLNLAQIAMAQRMARRLIAVGDPNQAIYYFRGADRKAIDRLVGDDTLVLPLPVTYRCASSIVAEANEFVPELRARPNAPEGEVEALPIDRALLSCFASRSRPTFVAGRSNAAITRALLFMRRTPNCPKITVLGAGEMGRQILEAVRRWAPSDIDDLTRKIDAEEERESDRLSRAEKFEALNDARDFYATVRQFAAESDCLSGLTKRVRELYRGDIQQQAPLVFSTVHRLKGQEADRVIMLEDSFRTDEEEERNICYVAITRARTTLTYAQGKLDRIGS